MSRRLFFLILILVLLLQGCNSLETNTSRLSKEVDDYNTRIDTVNRCLLTRYKSQQTINDELLKGYKEDVLYDITLTGDTWNKTYTDMPILSYSNIYIDTTYNTIRQNVRINTGNKYVYITLQYNVSDCSLTSIERTIKQ